jgi:signal recognition particle receptor subunit beta
MAYPSGGIDSWLYLAYNGFMSDYPTIIVITIAGPSGAGKTTFIRALDQDLAATPEDFGEIWLDDDYVVYLQGLPAPTHENHLDSWEIHAAFTIGTVIIIDSLQPETFDLACYTIDTLHEMGRDAYNFFTDTYEKIAPIPTIVAANKQDVPGALDIEEIRGLLELDEDVMIVPCVATDPESAMGVLLELLNVILEKQ